MKTSAILSAYVAVALCGLFASAVRADADSDARARWAAVAHRVAAEGTVLLKNDNGTLPLGEGESVAVYGGKYRKCGGGSSKVQSSYEISVPEGLRRCGVEIVKGRADAAVVTLTRGASEGADAKDEAYGLSEKELGLVETAAAQCGKVVVVLNTGHLVNVKPLKDNPRVGAILMAWFPGQEGGAAIAEIITGRVNPSGRLADTIAEKIEDYPSHRYFREKPLDLDYGEGRDVGYRYFNAKAKDRIVYPFGHGLSYTTFSESDEGPADGTGKTLRVTVANTGKTAGRHSVLRYENGELAAYAKTRLLAPGESQTLVLKPFDPSVRKGPAPEVADGEIDAVLAKLSIEEKVALCSAQPPAMVRGTAGVGNLPRFGFPNEQTADGPNGVRRYGPSTCHPAGALLAQTFDDDLAFETGRALGEEAASLNVDILLGPGLNIHRHPLCGRNFEYFSEDPLVSGRIAAAYVRGVQSTGVAATLKHFCCNSREWKRREYSSNVDERTLRDIYLKGFEIAVKEGRPRCVMTAYNKVNGTYTGECGWLVDGILRGEWGFDGLVMTDWRCLSEMHRQIAAGNDVDMPFGFQDRIDDTVEKVKSGQLSEKALDACAKRVLREVKRSRRYANRDFGPVASVSATGRTRIPGREAACVSSTWSASVDDPAEGWCHSQLGLDSRGHDTFLLFQLRAPKGGAYRVRVKAKTDHAKSRISLQAQGGRESRPLEFAATNAWETLGPVKVELPEGFSTLKVWFRGGAPFNRAFNPGVTFSSLEIEPCGEGDAGRDYASDAGFVESFRAGALAIARRKMAKCEDWRVKHADELPEGLKPRIATGGNFTGYFLWDSAFCVLWARYTTKEEGFPVEETLDNFYVLQTRSEDGLINREYSARGRAYWNPDHPVSFAPPLLAWAEMALYRSGRTDKARLERVFPHLALHHAACRRRYRRADGLYFGDALGCGMDDLPRWPRGMGAEERVKGGIPFTRDVQGPDNLTYYDKTVKRGRVSFYCWNRQAGWIDMTSQMALDAMELAAMARAIGKDAEADAYRAEYGELKELVNRLCWDEELGFYCDVADGGTIKRRHAGAFWALLARLAPPERARRMRDAMMDGKLFFRAVPFPALPAGDPDYRPDKAYWCGLSWPPTTYVGIHALLACGFRDDAEKAARRWYNANARIWEDTGTCRENIHPDTGAGRSGKDFCGWAALAPVALPDEFGWRRD